MSNSYTPTEWIPNRTIGTADVMNNMEEGILNAHQRVDALDSQVKDIADNIVGSNSLNWYNAKNYNIKGDGSTDDSSAFNILINTVNANGGGVIYIPKGIYMLDARIYPKSNVSLIGEGTGITVLKTRQAEGVGVGFAAIGWQGFSETNPMVNCTFKNFTIDGSEMNITEYTSWPKGINIHYLKDCIFKDLVIQNTCATGLGIDFLENVTIDNVTCYNCGRSWESTGTEANVGGAGIGIGTKRMEQESFIIRNCICDGCGNYGIFLEDQGGGSSTDYANFVISNNIVKNGRNHGIIVKGGDRVIVSNNVCYNNAGDGLAIRENNGFLTDIIKMTNNLVYNNKNGLCLECNGTTKDIFISDNVFSNNTNGVVINTAVEDLEIMRNTIKDNTLGLSLANGSFVDSVIKDNILINNKTNVSNNATFTGNTEYNDLVNIEATSIAFESRSYNVRVGSTITPKIIASPSGASVPSYALSSNNDYITVTGKNITGAIVGVSTLTATSGDLTATCTINILEALSSDIALSDYEYEAFIYNDAGQKVANNNSVTTVEFFDVSSYSTIYYKLTNLGNYECVFYACFFDENYNFISRTGENVSTADTYKQITIPDGTKYIKFRVGYAGNDFDVDIYNGCYIKFE